MNRAMGEWYDQAGVRVDLRRVLGEDLDEAKTFFPERLIPHLSHQAVRELPPEETRTLVARHLYQYLTFTTSFEMRVVNRAVERIATGRLRHEVPAQTRLDAYKIYCDEGYHALYSMDILHQIEAATGITALSYDFEPFLVRLDASGSQAFPDGAVFVQLLQVVVFETLITAVLNEVPKDPNVLTIVRDTVRDHARDEGRHHAFFAAFFQDLWAHLDLPMRERTARCLPQLIRHSLWPDLRPPATALRAAGLDEATTNEVIADVYAPEKILSGIRHAARHSVRLFENTGALDLPGGREAFESAGLLEAGARETAHTGAPS